MIYISKCTLFVGSETRALESGISNNKQKKVIDLKDMLPLIK